MKQWMNVTMRAPQDAESAPVPPREGGREPVEASDAAPRRPVLDLSVLVAIAALLLVDIIADSAGTSALHMTIEIAATGLAFAAAARLVVRWRAAQRALLRRVDELSGRLRAASADAERWRGEAREALEGLGAAIERQCDRWELSEAERAVAVLLLKGLSMKEVASARGTTERTVRQQALAVYRKAGLGGRAELSAFFLEDLLLPSAQPSQRA
jgi:DNA-binding CsgD family transcriptional regulator